MAKEVLACLPLHEWVRERPDTFIGSLATEQTLAWFVGWKPQLQRLQDTVATPVGATTLKKLLQKQVLLPADANKATSCSGGAAAADNEGDSEDAAKEEEQEEKASVADGAEDAAVGPTAPPAPAKLAAPALEDAAAVRLLVNVSPAAEKAVDEVMQNALDRCSGKDDTTTRIDVWVDVERGVIRVRNNGRGIPVTLPDPAKNPTAPKGELWPTILFSKEMAGGNFKRVEGMAHHQGGRNGVGAKATNICSKWFKVTVGDSENHKLFEQTWTDGMKHAQPAVVKPYRSKTGFVDVEFALDMDFFRVPFDEQFAAMARTRAWEMAAVTPDGVAVWLDGVRLPVKHLNHFVGLFKGSDAAAARPARSQVVAAAGGKVLWDVTVTCARDAGLPADTLAYVNGVRCCKGTHVNLLRTKLADALAPAVARRAKVDPKTVTGAEVQAALFVVLSVFIDGPAFSSQKKDKLATPASEWGFSWQPDAAFLKRVVTLCADAVADGLSLKTDSAAANKANKGAGGHVNIPKYEPAGTAGKANTRAMLVLCEGDSAKNLAMQGRTVAGTDVIGVYPLKGKPMNTRDKTVSRAAANVVLANVQRILGLEYGKVYACEADAAKLRYKHLVVMADQDVDGGHIVGLVVNWVESKWPSLLKLRPGFIKRMATPIVIATPRRGVGGGVVKFLSQPEFKRWLEEDATARMHGYNFQYYKGLGTHSDALAREYFQCLDQYMVELTFEDAGDASHESLLDFFDARRANVRRELLKHSYDAAACVDYSQAAVSISTFLRNETLHYSHDHNQRSLPRIDGLKNTQRKLLWACMRIAGGSPGREYKLTELAAECSKLAHYHHGEASLYSTMVGLAQAHIGTNNVNLLLAESQVGSRNAKRDVFAAPRYLKTGLEPIALKLFRPEDAPVLTYVMEDGKHVVEPVEFAPVVPIDLLNGCSGVGTGWSTEIPAFHPGEVADVFAARVRGDADWRARANGMLPWFDGFTGVVTMTATAWETYGLYHVEKVSDAVTNVVVSELPVGTWTDKYQKCLTWLVKGGSKSGGSGARAAASAEDADGGGDDEDGAAAPVSKKAGAAGVKTGAKAAGAAAAGGADSCTAKPGCPFIKHWASDSAGALVKYTLVCDSEAMFASVGGDTAAPFVADARAYPSSASQRILDQAQEVYRLGQPRIPALEEVLHLRTSTPLTIMHRFDADGAIVNYRSVADIVDAYYEFRIKLYADRLQWQVGALRRAIVLLENKVRFVGEMTSGTMNSKDYEEEAAWWKDLAARGYVSENDAAVVEPPMKTLSDLPALASADVAMAGADDAVGHDAAAENASGDDDAAPTYRYLTRLTLVSMTAKLQRVLTDELHKKHAALAEVSGQTPVSTWLSDLAEFKDAYARFMARRTTANRVVQAVKAGGGSGKKVKGARSNGRAKA